jgi:hypothetical protein
VVVSLNVTRPSRTAARVVSNRSAPVALRDKRHRRCAGGPTSSAPASIGPRIPTLSSIAIRVGRATPVRGARDIRGECLRQRPADARTTDGPAASKPLIFRKAAAVP